MNISRHRPQHAIDPNPQPSCLFMLQSNLDRARLSITVQTILFVCLCFSCSIALCEDSEEIGLPKPGSLRLKTKTKLFSEDNPQDLSNPVIAVEGVQMYG